MIFSFVHLEHHRWTSARKNRLDIEIIIALIRPTLRRSWRSYRGRYPTVFAETTVPVRLRGIFILRNLDLPCTPILNWYYLSLTT